MGGGAIYQESEVMSEFDDFVQTLTAEQLSQLKAERERDKERREKRIQRFQERAQKLSDGKDSPGVVKFGKANLVAPAPKEVKKVDTGVYCDILNKTGGATGGVNSVYAQRIAFHNATQGGYMKHNPQEDAKQTVVKPSVGTPENDTEDTDEDTDKFQPEQVSKGALEEMVKSLRKDARSKTTDDDTVNVATPEETSGDETERFFTEALAETQKEFAKYETAKQTGVE